MHLCAEHKNAAAFNLILKHSAKQAAYLLLSKNKQDETIFHVACKTGDLEIIKSLQAWLTASSGPSTHKFLFTKNVNGATCFHEACIAGHFTLCEYFLKDLKILEFIYHYDNDCNTPLHLATRHGHSDIVSLLVFYNADTTARNYQDQTALEISCTSNFLLISKILLSR